MKTSIIVNVVLFAAVIVLGVLYYKDHSKINTFKEGVVAPFSETSLAAKAVLDVPEYFTDSATLRMWQNEYKRNFKDPMYTKSVWFDKKMFQFIGHYFDSTQKMGADSIDGVRISFLQYTLNKDGEIIDASGNVVKITGHNPANNLKQLSISFLPTIHQKENWSLWSKGNVSKKLGGDDGDPGGLNHGSLCPEGCPEPNDN